MVGKYNIHYHSVQDALYFWPHFARIFISVCFDLDEFQFIFKERGFEKKRLNKTETTGENKQEIKIPSKTLPRKTLKGWVHYFRQGFHGKTSASVLKTNKLVCLQRENRSVQTDYSFELPLHTVHWFSLSFDKILVWSFWSFWVFRCTHREKHRSYVEFSKLREGNN